MTEPTGTLILVDADGKVTDDRDKAVRGEIVEADADGQTTSTMFTIERPSVTDAGSAV